MKIVARKSNLYTTTKFLNQVFQNDYIDGAYFEIVMTRDNEIVIFNPIYNNPITIQNSTFAQIQSEDVIALKMALSYFVRTGKRVIIDVIPITHPPLTDENIKMISKRNQLYIERVTKIIHDSGPLNIYLTSIDQKLIFHMKGKMGSIKIGLVFYPDNLNYVDVDFYVFGMETFNNDIIIQQIKRGKEVMFSIRDCNDLSTMLNYVMEKNIHTKDMESIKKMSFINNYPLIFHTLFKDI